MPTYYTRIESPVGRLLVAGDGRTLQFILWAEGPRKSEPKPDWQEDAKKMAEPVRQLKDYFAGKLEAFDLPLDPQGTPFQQKVWKLLCDIPYGETISYGELARRVGNPNASRAVGLANGSNPIAIIIPCHRVIGSNGKLTGYGGGLPNKEKLLALERRQQQLL